MSAKQILVKPIGATEANNFMRLTHYSGKVVPNSQIHLGVYYFGKLEGVMQFGPSLAKKNSIGLVANTSWNGFIELNRMAFSETLPRNSESRAIGIALRMIKKNAPSVEWVISFADGTQCGDGTIYRASGFVLTDIKPNTQLRIDPETGEPKHAMTAYHNGNKDQFSKWKKIPGWQLRYIYFINPEARKRLAVPELPFSKIAEMGATMYKGSRPESTDSDASDFRSEESGAIPTSRLQPNEAQ